MYVHKKHYDGHFDDVIIWSRRSTQIREVFLTYKYAPKLIVIPKIVTNFTLDYHLT